MKGKKINLNQARENLRNLQAALDTEREQGLTLAADESATAEQLRAQADKIAAAQSRVSLLSASIAEQESEEGAQGLDPIADPKAGKSLKDMLKSNEYARAFASAVLSGVQVKNARGIEEYKILYDALTEAGGNPVGSDGGFLVPEDIDHAIRELRRSVLSFAEFFQTEETATNKGWRVKDVTPTKGFAKLGAELQTIPMDDQPRFARVDFSLDTYSLRLPISNELAADEVANLFNYCARWYGKKLILTENNMLLALLEEAEQTAFSPASGKTALNAIKTVLNRTLDPAISATSMILTNQDGFDYLDQLEDKQGRPLMQPDPTTGTPMLLKSRRVVMASNAILPSEMADGKPIMPIYIGDFSAYGTLFRRQPLELRSTDVGGNAWVTNSIEMRGIARLGANIFDDLAVHCLLVSEA